MSFRRSRGVANRWIPSISRMRVLRSSSWSASWSCLDRVTSLPSHCGTVSNCHSRWTFWSSSSWIGAMEVSRHCCGVGGHPMEGIGPWSVHPRHVWTAAGAPRPPHRTGSVGVMRWGWSEPMRSKGWTSANVRIGRPRRCLYFCCSCSTG